MDGERRWLTTRKVLWAHTAAVGSLMLALASSRCDFHAVHPTILYIAIIPAVFSIWLFPPLFLYAIFRDSGRGLWSVIAESLLLLMHWGATGMGF